MNSIKQPLICLTRDDRGFALTIELTLIATILLLGSITGLASVRDAAISELSDIAGGMQDLNQGFRYAGIEGHSGSTVGSNFDDALDFCDSAEDLPGQADNCITFDGPPENESGGGDGGGGEIREVSGNFDDVDPADAVRTIGRREEQAFHFDPDDVPGWQTTPDAVIEIWDSGFRGVESQDGDYHAELNGPTPAQLFQEFSVSPGETIEYSIWHRGRHGVDEADILIGPPGMQTVQQTISTDNTAWVQYTGTYIVPAGVSTVRIGFESVSTATGGPTAGNFLDNFEVSISD